MLEGLRVKRERRGKGCGLIPSRAAVGVAEEKITELAGDLDVGFPWVNLGPV